MASDVDRDAFTINLIVEPQLILDLVLIEPIRQPMGPVAETFLKLLENETGRVGARLAKIPATIPEDGQTIDRRQDEIRTDRAILGQTSRAQSGERSLKSLAGANMTRRSARIATKAPA
jgi:hypothetical protein